MRQFSTVESLAVLLSLCWLQPAVGAPAAPPAAAELPGGVTILQTRQWTADGKTPTGTIWRTFQTWRTDVARTEKGELVPVNSLTPRSGRDNKGQVVRWNCALPGWALQFLGKNTQLELYPAKTLHGSAWPPAGWQAPDFDDQFWTRDPYPQRELYGLVALRCLRGKFEVPDPARAGELVVTVRFRGGAVAYVNGKEVGRAFLPQRELKPDTLAEDYPKEAYVDPDGVLLLSHGMAIGRDRTEYGLGEVARGIAANSFTASSPDVVTRYQSRCRKLQVKIPAALLRKGTNVLAVEIHRAPAWEGMFTSPGYSEGKKSLFSLVWGDCWWDRCDLEDVRLTAAAGGAVVPNVAARQGVRVWNHAADVELDPSYYADPSEPLQPVRLRGLKNGSYSGALVVSSPTPIQGLNVQVTDLKGPGGSIPATAIAVAYPHLADGFHGGSKTGKGSWPMFDTLEPRPPTDIGPTPWGQTRTFPPMQPVWLTVRVPRDAKAGTYRGTVTVSVEGAAPAPTPLDLEVVGNWALPDPQAFTTYMGFLECPDAVAKEYKVALWSEEHWKLLDQVFAVLGQVGTKEVFVPLVAKTHLGNPSSMVRWARQSDGTYKADTAIAERYLDTALKHLGKIPVVCLYITNYENLYQMPRNEATADQAIVTEIDPATGALKDLLPPKWGTPEGRAFWKPALDRMRDILAKRGLEKSTMFGYMCNEMGAVTPGAANGVPNYFSDLWTLAPNTRWLLTTHLGPGIVKADKLRLKTADVLGTHSWMHGLFNNVWWMDDDDTVFKVRYGWRDRAGPYYMLAGSRSRSTVLYMDHCANVNRLRIAPEAVLLSQGTFTGSNPYQGLGSWGADFWGNEHHIYEGRFGDCGISESTELWMVGPGDAGPVSTCRLRMLQEGLQEAEARIFVQNAVLDQQAKLGPDLARRCKELCDERTRMLSYVANFRYSDGEGTMPRLRWIPDVAAWDDAAVKLYQAADDVAKALGRP